MERPNRFKAFIAFAISFFFAEFAAAAIPDPAVKTDEALTAIDGIVEKVLTWGWATAIAVGLAFLSWRLLKKVPRNVT